MPSFIWTLPTRADGRRRHPALWNRGDWEPGNRVVFDDSIRDVRGEHFGSFDYLVQTVRAADLSGFDGITIPYDPGGEESWVAASVALRNSRYVQVIPEFPAGFATPVYAAKMSTTLQRASGARLGWRVAVDSAPAVARTQADFLQGDDRFVRAGEFVTAAKGVFNATGYHFEGGFYQVDGGGFAGPLGGQPFPVVHTSGTSKAALAFAAEHADVHVFEGDGRAVVAERIAALRAAAAGRAIRVAVTLPVIAREHTAEALAKAQRLLALAGNGGDASDLATAGGCWLGFRHIGLPQQYGLVGSFEQVADQLRALVDLGVDTFILDTPGRLEGAYLLGENLLPLFSSLRVEVPA